MSTDETGPRRGALTGRQREIAAGCAWNTNREIAAKMVISPFTAANHMNQILRRLGLGSRSELAAWAESAVTSGRKLVHRSNVQLLVTTRLLIS